MHIVGKIDIDIYKCISADIRTDEVIITDERIEHIKERHPDDYRRFRDYLPEILSAPDYILRDERPDTAMILKDITEINTGNHLRLTLRIATRFDTPGYKNSILTFMHVHEREYERVIRNKEILYKKAKN